MELNTAIRGFIESNFELFGEEKVFTDSDNIFDLKLVSSLFAMKLIKYIEENFDIVVEPDDMDITNFNSINNIMKFIEDKRRNYRE